MVEVQFSTIFDAPVDRMRAVLRDLNGHDRWHPAVDLVSAKSGPHTDCHTVNQYLGRPDNESSEIGPKRLGGTRLELSV